MLDSTIRSEIQSNFHKMNETLGATIMNWMIEVGLYAIFTRITNWRRSRVSWKSLGYAYFCSSLKNISLNLMTISSSSHDSFTDLVLLEVWSSSIWKNVLNVYTINRFISRKLKYPFFTPDEMKYSRFENFNSSVSNNRQLVPRVQQSHTVTASRSFYYTTCCKIINHEIKLHWMHFMRWDKIESTAVYDLDRYRM